MKNKLQRLKILLVGHYSQTITYLLKICWYPIIFHDIFLMDFEFQIVILAIREQSKIISI